MRKLTFIAMTAFAVFSSNVAKADLTLSGAVANSYGANKITETTSKTTKVTHKKIRHESDTITVASNHSAGPRPGAWCGWFMRTIFGGGPEYNLARNWAKRGRSAGGPAVGAVVVWPHHVGVIVGQASNGQWLVHSGNDSNRVRTRARSVAGAIAFRFV